MASLTIENYVKAIYSLTADNDNATATTGALAAMLRVSPSSVTSMLKTLHESELADHKPYEGVRLTDKGSKLALRVLRRHRLIELFLHRTLQLSWDEVHEEAEHMEHAVSDLLVDRIDEFLGFPGIDPHGDPIPRSDGSVSAVRHATLSELPPQTRFRVERVLDQSVEFLRYLADIGLAIGAEGLILGNCSTAGTITVCMHTDDPQCGTGTEPPIQVRTTLGHSSAAKLLAAAVE